MEKIWLNRYQQIPAEINLQTYHSLNQFFAQACRKFPSQPALSFFQQTINYQQWADLSHHLSAFLQQQLKLQLQRMQNRILTTLQQQQQFLSNVAIKLDALSPLATLKRGFSIATVTKDQTILRSAKQVAPGDKISLQLLEGNVTSIVIT